MGRLDGKVVIITGAARGQGEAEARLFAQEGAQVLLGDVRDEQGQSIARQIGGSAHYARLDVTEEDDWARAVREAGDRFGRIDALINNAGILAIAPIAQCSREDFVRVLEVNLVGSFLGIKAVTEPIARSGGGSIVNVSSVAGLQGVPGMPAYVSSKFGIRGLTKVAAIELGAVRIRVNSIHPGGVDTDMLRIPELAHRDVGATYGTLPIARLGEAAEVARLALFLISDESSYCTGAEFVIDGGIMAGQRLAPAKDRA